MPPLIQNVTVIQPNAVNDNVLTGSQYEYLPYNARIEWGLVASATGLFVDVFSGQDTVTEQMAPSLQNRFPVYPDDFTLIDVAAAGERLKVRVRNTTAGTLSIFHATRITPI